MNKPKIIDEVNGNATDEDRINVPVGQSFQINGTQDASNEV